eukprot:861657_1
MKKEELEKFMCKATAFVKKFYIERYLPRYSLEEVTQFFDRRDLLPGDWKGLTEQLASSLFSNEIIVPLEVAADSLVVEANLESGFETLVDEAMKEQGIVEGFRVEYHFHPVEKK